MLSDNLAIKIDHVHKLFRKQEQKTFKEFLPALFSGKKTSNTFWALRDLDFEVKKGEVIGIIGPNGSGKSTFLKLIAGVSQPTKGEIITQGKIAPLIELGAGFHPELTGRENVFLNGIILGMTRKDVQDKFNDIVAFAELEEFIDQPVKHYSSGMYLRLAFAVAIHTDPDIFLIDEILAVGDEKFQKKCLRKLDSFKKNNKTIVFVSHNIHLVLDFCDRALYLNKGKVVIDGNVHDTVTRYSADARKRL